MICFHHNDPDGRCAGAIVNKKFINAVPSDIKFIEMEYSKEPLLDQIIPEEVVFIVDFSFKPEVMEKIYDISKNITWIDHHKTILDHPWNNDNIAGIRQLGKSGALLTWEYLYDAPAPLAVKLVSDYDCWILSDERSKPFVFGLQLQDISPRSSFWDKLLDSNTMVPKCVVMGQTCLDFVKKFGTEYGTSYGFETTLEGHKCFAQGFYMFGSTAFGERINQYDICLSYEFFGDKWIVGLYSVNPDIDVSAIAKKHGGGGHKGAAGFVCNELPFVKN